MSPGGWVFFELMDKEPVYLAAQRHDLLKSELPLSHFQGSEIALDVRHRDPCPALAVAMSRVRSEKLISLPIFATCVVKAASLDVAGKCTTSGRPSTNGASSLCRRRRNQKQSVPLRWVGRGMRISGKICLPCNRRV
jgi:hypothetical protein